MILKLDGNQLLKSLLIELTLPNRCVIMALGLRLGGWPLTLHNRRRLGTALLSRRVID